MSGKPKNSGKPWTPKDIEELRKLVKQDTPTRIEALDLGRTEEAIRSKASELGLSLKPTNQSSYGRKC